MKGEPRVIDYLNKALCHERTVVNQFWLHARLYEHWGYIALAAKEKEESLEEWEHADRLLARIVFLEGEADMQTLDTLRIGSSLKDCIECDLAGEYAARALYTEARDVCKEERDYVTKALFEGLLLEEEGHINWLESQLALIEKIGSERYALLQSKEAK